MILSGILGTGLIGLCRTTSPVGTPTLLLEKLTTFLLVTLILIVFMIVTSFGRHPWPAS